MFRRLLTIVAVTAITGMGCSSESPLAPDGMQTDDFGDQGQSLSRIEDDPGMAAGGRWWRHCGPNDSVMFTVTIENVSTGMTLQLSNGETAPAPHSPGVWTLTRLFNPLFKVGRFDLGEGLEQQAEDGDPTALAASMAGKWYVKSYGVFNTPVGDAAPGPATPGKAYQFSFMACPGDRLSFTSMFGQSNDLFYAPGFLGIPLFRRGMPREGDITRYFSLWDAGTEVNQEPGLGPDQAPRQSGPNTGETEHRRVLRVRDSYTYPDTDEVIRVTLTVSSPVS